MPPLPKRKISKGRRDRRRSHLALETPAVASCPNCHKAYTPHHVCSNCGYYDGEQIFVVEAKKPKTKS